MFHDFKLEIIRNPSCILLVEEEDREIERGRREFFKKKVNDHAPRRQWLTAGVAGKEVKPKVGFRDYSHTDLCQA